MPQSFLHHKQQSGKVIMNIIFNMDSIINSPIKGIVTIKNIARKSHTKAPASKRHTLKEGMYHREKSEQTIEMMYY